MVFNFLKKSQNNKKKSRWLIIIVIQTSIPLKSKQLSN